jgi:hypothetical protein
MHTTSARRSLSTFNANTQGTKSLKIDSDDIHIRTSKNSKQFRERHGLLLGVCDRLKLNVVEVQEDIVLFHASFGIFLGHAQGAETELFWGV